MKTKHEMREAAIERLRSVISNQSFVMTLCADDITKPLVGDGWVDSTVEEDAKTIIDLLTDDESYEDDAYAMGPRDANGIIWIRGDMSDSEWGVIERTYFDGEQWMVCGHDISAPWIPADSIRHVPMRTATQREDVCRCRNCIATKRNNDLIELLKDAAKDYQHEREEVEWQKELYRSMSDHVISDTMLLPRDADDEVIHVGDELQWDDGESLTVIGVGNDIVFYVNDDGLGGAQWTKANNKHHYKKPTVEEVLREFAIACENTGNAGPEVQRLAGEYAKKLQLKEDE